MTYLADKKGAKFEKNKKGAFGNAPTEDPTDAMLLLIKPET